jgi:hypothetical protein
MDRLDKVELLSVQRFSNDIYALLQECHMSSLGFRSLYARRNGLGMSIRFGLAANCSPGMTGQEHVQTRDDYFPSGSGS